MWQVRQPPQRLELQLELQQRLPVCQLEWQKQLAQVSVD